MEFYGNGRALHSFNCPDAESKYENCTYHYTRNEVAWAIRMCNEYGDPIEWYPAAIAMNRDHPEIYAEIEKEVAAKIALDN